MGLEAWIGKEHITKESVALYTGDVCHTTPHSLGPEKRISTSKGKMKNNTKGRIQDRSLN